MAENIGDMEYCHFAVTVEGVMAHRIEIDVRTLYDFAGKGVPENPPSPEALREMVLAQFSFLPEPLTVEFHGWRGEITYGAESTASKAESERLGAKAAKRAQQGDYDKAVGIWKRALELDPANYTLRRDLAMAYVEKGEMESAKNHLIEVLRMQPNDVWGLVVLSNLYNKHEHDLEAAERFLSRARAIDSDDPWVLNALGAIRVEQGRLAEAIGLFADCIAVNPSFANPYLGMALAQRTTGNREGARCTLEGLFAKAQSQDARSAPVFSEARRTYAALISELAETMHDDTFKTLENIKQEMQAESGYPVRVEVAPSGGGGHKPRL